MAIMSMVSDFKIIQNGHGPHIGDGNLPGWEKTFEINEIVPAGMGVLMLMVKGLTLTNQSAVINMNGKPLGEIFPYPGASPDHWFTQIITFDTRCLHVGVNTMEVRAVPGMVTTPHTAFDAFEIRNVICLFHELT